MVVCYIALGSNLGDRRYHIETALKMIRQLPETKVKKVSQLWDTRPEGGPPGQGMYLNGVAEVETGLYPYRLLQELQRIEVALGRVRLDPNGPRTIDLDILTYGDSVIREEALCVPHPRMFAREFVLGPLREIASPATVAKIRKLAAPARKKRPIKRIRVRKRARVRTRT